jgi:hypothetical protein
MSSFFSTIFGRAPAPKWTPQSAEAVRDALLAINRSTAPFVVRPGGEEETELVAEWRIADPGWHEVFARANVERTVKVLIRLDAAAKEVRAADQEWSVEWRAGAPSLSLAVTAFRAQRTEVEFGKAHGFTETVGAGEINYRFTTAELKGPLQRAVTGQGWLWRSVAFGKL